MALVEDIFTGGTVAGIAVGLGAVLLAPTVLPAVARVLRPAAKAVIKGGLVVYRETVSEIGEVANDLFAEARAELESGEGRAVATGTGRAARSEGH